VSLVPHHAIGDDLTVHEIGAGLIELAVCATCGDPISTERESHDCDECQAHWQMIAGLVRQSQLALSIEASVRDRVRRMSA
jgi:Zn finger protein HypA/HybF involved in hydrogenase expression